MQTDDGGASALGGFALPCNVSQLSAVHHELINMKQMPETKVVALEQQICFAADGMMFCNYVIRQGKVIKSKLGKWLRFPAPHLKQKKKDKTKENTPSFII
ncbi:MAG: hypothetical protein PHI63_01625 [Patescibacteria group bacterium]|nr:hypothetical protein [Patescibacteria group bacterium]